MPATEISMSHKLSRAVGALAAILAIGAIRPASAEPITYTFAGSGAFSLNGVDSLGSFSFTFNGDTDNVFGGAAPFFLNELLGGSVSLTPSGSASSNFGLQSDFIIQSNASTPSVSFFDTASTAGVSILDASLAGYDLTTAFGPLGASGTDVVTNLGDITLADGSTLTLESVDSASFIAVLDNHPTTVPEPASLAVLAGAAISLAWRRRISPAKTA
jgi:hypothetical protein